MNRSILFPSFPGDQASQRTPIPGIPADRATRRRIRLKAFEYWNRNPATPPLPLETLFSHVSNFCEESDISEQYKDYAAISLNNAIWWESFAQIDYKKRLLLLPKCLRDASRCQAEIDAFGLICAQCKSCLIHSFEEEAERLGYSVLVAEGSAMVMELIKSGQIEAIIGVSCMNVLEKSFQYMEAAAIPGLAAPLMQDDCKDCSVDIDLIHELLHLSVEDRAERIHLDEIHQLTRTWFEAGQLGAILGEPETETDRISFDWLSGKGKRWRPFLTVCAHRALVGDDRADDKALKLLAASVECFHKASLVHDDIEDEDAERYGEKTLHELYDIPIAINIGDHLVGEGYRCLAESGFPPECTAEMIRIAAEGHRRLCCGQGAELLNRDHGRPLTVEDTLKIFRLKTAPAFHVALALGALSAGANREVMDCLVHYSDAIGIAYQIQDDIDDWRDEARESDGETRRPSVIASLIYQAANAQQRERIESFHQNETSFADARATLDEILVEQQIIEQAETLLQSYKHQAVISLQSLEHRELKGLLRRVISKIFNDLQFEGWCREFENRHDSGRAASATLAE